MKSPTAFHARFLLAALLPFLALGAGRSLKSAADIPPPFPALFQGLAKKNLTKSALDAYGPLISPSSGRNDTIHIVAFRFEFNGGHQDSSSLTTGTGRFGENDDPIERDAYAAGGAYKYDRTPHYKAYFDSQLAYVRTYYQKVSRGRLTVDYTIYPDQEQGAFNVPKPMADYSPAQKQKQESWNEYYERKTLALMRFVRDALLVIKTQSGWADSLRTDGTGRTVDAAGRPVVVLILHAGASYLTDGGKDGSYGRNSPSDMIDWFITRDVLKAYRDTLHLDTCGVNVRTAGGDSVLIDQVMLAPETSNQDKLNWGIHGILVNQVARALGIPDLFSTSSGITGIGAFCIMDFAGYSAGNGFIPPWPSAWVRTFMGWDNPVVVEPGVERTYRVKAIGASSSANDTTILMVPINDHEYYLIENRQRDLSGAGRVFNYDTTENKDTTYISAYPYNVKLDSAVTAGGPSSTVSDARNYDVGLPASGAVVWHIDDNIIRDRLRYNIVNADSNYQGVRLVEADGITDLGITYQNVFYEAAYDYGGAEDVFPHVNLRPGRADTTVISMGPWTRPSTSSNDGGRTNLTLTIDTMGHAPPAEKSASSWGYYVVNYADSVFKVAVKWNSPPPAAPGALEGVRTSFVAGWPKRMLPDTAFEPVVCDLYKKDGVKELAVLTASGRLYVWPADTAAAYAVGPVQKDSVPVLHITRADSADTSTHVIKDAVRCLKGPSHAAAFPTAIGGRLYVAAADSVDVLDSIVIRDRQAADPDSTAEAVWRGVKLPGLAASYVCGLQGSRWAVGCASGLVAFGDTAGGAVTAIDTLSAASPVCALAAFRGGADTLVCIQLNGMLSICRPGARPIDTTTVPGLAPYWLVTGDLDNDGRAEIVVSDSRQGLWCFTHTLGVAAGWHRLPVDWPSAYTYLEHDASGDRGALPVNTTPPALADINGDGHLDIVISGTNGIYALNYKGVLLSGWPAILDNRFAYYRGSVTTAPVVACDKRRGPLVLFSSPTGEQETFSYFHIDSVSRDSTKVYFTRAVGSIDSIGGLRHSFVDSLFTYGDSLIPDYVLPGGTVDARTALGVRPVFVNNLPNVGPERQSFWPVTIGEASPCAPMIDNMDGGAKPDLFALSRDGWVYRWKLENAGSLDACAWPQTGFDGSRSFAYLGPLPVPPSAADPAPIKFYSYPNPARDVAAVQFKFKFNGPADNVRLDIFTYTGYHVYSWQADPQAFRAAWADWSELPSALSLRSFGPGVYRCRLAADVKGKAEHAYWKMAVVK